MKYFQVILSHVLFKPGHVSSDVLWLQDQNTLSLAPNKISVSFVERAWWLIGALSLRINASGHVWTQYVEQM